MKSKVGDELIYFPLLLDEEMRRRVHAYLKNLSAF